MTDEDRVHIVRNSDLSIFCESKLRSYTKSLKEASLFDNRSELKEILLNLSEDFESFGAFHTSSLAKSLSLKIEKSESNFYKDNKKLSRIIGILEDLEKDSKSYINSEWYTKKIETIDTLRLNKVAETVLDPDEFDLENEFNEQWKCCIY